MSYANIKITNWGIKIDLQGLIFVAAVTALNFVINTMVIPVAPSIWMKFGGSVGNFVSTCTGPLWATISTMVSVAYVGLLIHGDVAGIFVAGFTGFAIAFFDKWVPPLVNVGLSSPLTGVVSILQQVFITGSPVALAVQIFMKRIATGVVNSLVFTLLYSMPGIYRYVPMYYDSWVVRYWLLKIEEEEAED